jgi:hypothetical protein
METTPNGYVKLYRCLLDNPIVCKDAEHFAIWCYLLLKATHKDIDMLFNGKRIKLKPGQLITGRKVISTKLGIDESKVKRILISFESDQQIDRERGNRNSLISILNWEKYQQSDQQSDQQVTSKCPADDQQVTTNKKVKNIKNDKNDKNIIPYPLEEFEFSSTMESKIKEWITYKIEKKDTYQPTGFKNLMTVIKKNIAQYGEQSVLDLIDSCMANNWKGIIWERITKEAKIENTRNNTAVQEATRGNEQPACNYDKFFD